jgi:low temperature requirement protein LtrA
VVLVAATALFLAWRTALVALISRRLSWWLPVGMVAVVAALPAVVHLPPAAVSAVVDTVLLLVALAELARSRRDQREPMAASA